MVIEPKHGQILGVQKLCKVGEEQNRGHSKTSKEGLWFCPTKVPPTFFWVQILQGVPKSCHNVTFFYL
jgi:hypothetical protein